MAITDLTLTVGGNAYDLSKYNPTVSWRLNKTIEYFKFPGSDLKIMLDLLENEETITLDCRVVANDISAIANMIIDIRSNGTDPTSNTTTLLWSTVGTMTVSVRDVELRQKAGEGDFYNLSIKFYMTEGPV